MAHYILLFLWTWSIIRYSKNEATMFRELALLPSSGKNTHAWIGISTFYQTQKNRNFHLKMGAEPAPET
jgi:hypothetical protein